MIQLPSSESRVFAALQEIGQVNGTSTAVIEQRLLCTVDSLKKFCVTGQDGLIRLSFSTSLALQAFYLRSHCQPPRMYNQFREPVTKKEAA